MDQIKKTVILLAILSLTSCGGLWGKKDKEEVSDKPKKEQTQPITLYLY